MNFAQNSLPPEKIFNEIKFTSREIDILACILEGRTTKRIATFLSLSPKTVENYIHDLRSRLGCNSREGIKDFIEKSHNTLFFKNHYLALMFQSSFEQRLKTFSDRIEKEEVACILYYWPKEKNDAFLFHNLKKHLNLAGVKVTIKERTDAIAAPSLIDELEAPSKDAIFYFVPQTLQSALDHLKNVKIVSLNKDEALDNICCLFYKGKNKVLIHFPKSYPPPLKNQILYYSGLVEIFADLFPALHLRDLLEGLSQNLKCPVIPQLSLDQTNARLKKENHKKRYQFVIGGLVCFMIGCGIAFFILKGASFTGPREDAQKKGAVYSELVIPTRSSFLQRPDLLSQIESKLAHQKQGIQTVALVGMGGVGKTILARHYAHQQNTNVVWEINAETHEAMNSSFERLAQALAKTPDSIFVLKEIQEIKNLKEREAKLVDFVKERLRRYVNWILIYDNANTFKDIQTFFPYDFKAWGHGKVVVTTRNSNIYNNKHINDIIKVGELTSNQRLLLFSKIMTQGNVKTFTSIQAEETSAFLEKLPPFPLDISLAAYYIKTTNISYGAYLKNLACLSEAFEEVQESLLREAGNYTKTRYAIMALSFQHLIKAHKDFADLLILISLVDSQNIPRDLLDSFKNNIVVDNFIYHLKKYSFITDEFSPLHQIPSFSIHRSTQTMGLTYIAKTFDLAANKQLILPLMHSFENYIENIIENQDLLRMKLLISHCKKLLTHHTLLNEDIKGSISGKLGYIYYYISDYGKAERFLNEALMSLNKNPNNNNAKIARVLVYLGIVSRESGDYERAKDLLEQSLSIYQNSSSKDYFGIFLNLGFLGIVYKSLGHFEKAKDLLEQSLSIYEEHPSKNCTRKTWVLAYLGNIYGSLGQFEKGKALLEESLTTYENQLPKNHVKVAWASAHLAKIYKNLGYYEKAKGLLEQSLEIYKKHSFKNNEIAWAHEIAWVSAHLGNVYRKLGEYKKAKALLHQSLSIYNKYYSKNLIRIAWVSSYLGNLYKGLKDYQKAQNLLEKSLITYEKVYGKDHIETARILRDLSLVYLWQGHLEAAEPLIVKALHIFKQAEHPESYTCLESLAEIYLKKSLRALNNGDLKQSQSAKKQAISYLKQALETAEMAFLEHSPHRERIKEKLGSLLKHGNRRHVAKIRVGRN